jgi:uncharacterized membrane protein
MSPTADIARIVELQAQLTGALDNMDLDGVELASNQLASALARVGRSGAMISNGGMKDELVHALRQNDALKTRIRYLADKNRQKIDALAQIRTGRTEHIYQKP